MTACAYFLRPVDDHSRVKIGGTGRSSKKRLKELQTGSASALEVIGTFTRDGATWSELESELHTRFAEYRVRGEWFRWCQEIEAFIREHCDIPDPKVERVVRVVQNTRIEAGEIPACEITTAGPGSANYQIDVGSTIIDFLKSA